MQIRFLRSAIAAVALSLTLAACGKPDQAPPVTDPAQTLPTEQPAPVPAEQPAPAEPAPTPAPAPKPKPRPAPVAPTPPPAPQVCYDCGTITNIAEIRQKGSGSGAGAVAGGVADRKSTRLNSSH